ncbi:hypothetical protein LJC40_07205, partial [Synergistaceae bacterium OttesenSCG-928-D05]|nr:hypothetical protein [Synergistaceae bacterium OttesenSCG-928-D05]
MTSVDIKTGNGLTVGAGETLTVSPDGIFVRSGANATAVGVTVNADGTLVILDGDILVERNPGGSSFSSGVYANGGTVRINAGNITASTSRTRGVRLKGSDATISADRIIASGDLAHGVSTYNNQSTNNTGSDVTIKAGEIIASGSQSAGVYIGPANSADVSVGSVTVSGQTSEGVRISDGTINVTEHVDVSGNSSVGVNIANIEANGKITIGGNVSVTGNNSNGARNWGAGGNVAVGGNVLVSADSSNGVYVHNSGSGSIHGNITVSGAGSTGLRVTGTNAGSLSAASVEGDVSVSGAGSYGIYMSAWSGDARVDGDINASGGATGIHIRSDVTGGASMANVLGTITAEGEGTIGADLHGSSDTMNIAKVIASGDNLNTSNHAVGVRTKGTANIGTDADSENIFVTGSNNTGVVLLGGTINTLGTTALSGDGLIGIDVQGAGTANLDTVAISGGQDNIGVKLDSTSTAQAKINQVLIADTASGDNIAVLQTRGVSEIGYIFAGAKDSLGLAISGGRSTVDAIDVDGTGAAGAIATSGSLTVGGLLSVVDGVGVIASGDSTVRLSGASVTDGIGLFAVSANADIVISDDWFVNGHGQGMVVSNDATVLMKRNLDVVAGGTGASVELGTLTIQGNMSAASADSIGVDVFADGQAYLGSVSAADGATGAVSAGLLIASEDIVANNNATGIKVTGGTTQLMQALSASGDSRGAYVSGGILTVEGLVTAGDGSYGILADDGVAFADSVTVNGAKAKGVYASDNGQIYVSKDIILTGTIAGSYGAVAGLGGSVDVQGDIKSTAAGASGDAIYGAYAFANGEISVTGGISMVGDYSFGGAADSGDVYLGGNIAIEGKNSAGASALNGGSIEVAGDITVDGDFSIGASAVSNASITISNDVETRGVASGGVRAEDLSTINVGGNVTTHGNTSGDLYADAVTALSGSTVNVSGDAATYGYGAYGVFAASEDTLVHIGGNVMTMNDDAHGVDASDTALTIVDGWIKTYGYDSTGVNAESGSLVVVNKGIETVGDASHAAYTDSGTILIADDIGGGSVLVSTAGENSHGLFAENKGFIGVENGDIEVADNTAWHMYVNTGSTIDLTDVTAGMNDNLNLLRTDSNGAVIAKSSFLSGDITHTGADDGTLAVILRDGTDFIGAANADPANPNARIDITLDARGSDISKSDYWQVTKDSNMQGNLTNRGIVDFVHSTETDFNGQNAFVVDDSAYKKITIDNLTGTIGTASDPLGVFIMKADVNANKSDHIYGIGRATGINDIDLQMMGYAGAERMDQPLIVMNHIDSSDPGSGPGSVPTSDAGIQLRDGALTENGIVDAGAWNYALAEGMDGYVKEWY